MKKRLICGLLILALCLALGGGALAADMAAAGEAADLLWSLGLMEGDGLDEYGEPTYSLGRAPNRQEAIAMLVRLLGAEEEALSGSWTTPFTDVQDWARPYVGYAYARALTDGMTETLFGAGYTVSAAQYLTFVLRAMGYVSGEDFRWNAAWELSDALGFTAGEYGPDGGFLRADVALVSVNALSAAVKGGGDLSEKLGLGDVEGLRVMKVHFIDVGQADSILLSRGGEYMLVDGGNRADAALVREFLREHGVTALKYVVATHPHEDHIGGLPEVIGEFAPGAVLAPAREAATKIYQAFLDSLSARGLSLTHPAPGNVYTLGGARLTILAPGGDYGGDMNNCSIVVKAENGEDSFLLCGDAELESERDMLAAGLDVSADVLKAGHHGSGTSTGAEFLAAVGPDWAVISCGAGNTYGHPDQETLDALTAAGVGIFRTDTQGTVSAYSSGVGIRWTREPAA